MAVIVAALGYFVDIYDLVLFGVVRRASLLSLGVIDTAPAVMSPWQSLALQWKLAIGAAAGNTEQTGAMLLSAQMVGMLIGGFAWGVLGDRRGRLSVLFGSIVLYSLANLGNAFASNVPAYAVLRLVAGIGLAGELGAGITLVSEQLPARLRGYGTMVVASVGLGGAVAAGLVGNVIGASIARWLGSSLEPWRFAYIVGGTMGLALLCLRVGVAESGLFERGRAGAGTHSRGALRMLFSPLRRAIRYQSVLLVAVPIWYVGGIFFFFAPEMGRALGLVGSDTPTAGMAVVMGYSGAVIGDCASGLLSQLLRSRKRVIGLFLAGIVVGIGCTLTLGGASTSAFYACIFGVGLATGYWAIFVTTASESFGTNLRATVTTTAPNLVRGAAVPITLAWQMLRDSGQSAVTAAIWVGAVCVVLAVAALAVMPETFGRDLDFVEE